MIDKLTQSITPLTVFPDRVNYTDSDSYAEDVASWLRENKELSRELAELIPAFNAILEQIDSETELINSLKPIVLGALNYKGEYVQGQVYNLNDSVSIEDIKYISKIDNNTDTPPSQNWLEVPTTYTKTQIDKALWDFDRILGILDSIKANKDDVYTKAELDEKIADVAKKQYKPLFEKKLFGGL